MKKLKKYFIGSALMSSPDDPFEKMKIELTFNLISVWIPLSIISSIPLIIGEFWFMLCLPTFTTLSTFVALLLFKQTSSYKHPSIVWLIMSLISIFSMHIIGGGNLRGIDVLWISLSSILAFILLGKRKGLYVFIFNAILLIWSSLIFIELIPSHQFSIFEHEQKLFQNPDLISVLIPIFAIGYILYSFISAQEKAQQLLYIQKEELNKKRLKIELVQKETEESIYYAKRIQTALLPPKRIIRQSLKNSFILYKPKEIISGDFYWVLSIENATYFAVADSTGSGVPGAMISVICMNALNRSIKEFNISDPAEILNKTRNLIISQFNKDDGKMKDGMDISFCALDTETNKLSWAGANRPIWILKHETNDIEEIKPNNQPVGESSLSEPFTTHSIQLNKGDMIYIFTDGFENQFGDKTKEKYSKERLKSKLSELSEKPLNTQDQLLDFELENWKGELEATDDTCIMGVRIN